MKLKLNTSGKVSSPGAASPATQTPTPGSGGIKLKLKTSAPPTPATEQPIIRAEPLAPPPTKPKRPYNKKPKAEDGTSKKRAADTDISPAAKRASKAEPQRRISFKVGSKAADGDDLAIETPTSAGPKLKLGGRKQSTGPKNITLTTKKRPQPRPIGVGYDSEASDAETDPAIEQQFILRMDPGEDCKYLTEAIANKTVGLRPEDGGADVSFRFVERELRRAIVTVRGRRYAACMVDLPCIVEGMKSWDRRGWWKVADICQMLLVLGRCKDEAEAKEFALPKEVDKNTFAYAHGLTAPMHWVRKRRFRKRVSYREIENVEEEVERLLKEDAACKRNGGSVNWNIYDADAVQRQGDTTQQDDEYPEDEYMESTEDQYGQGPVADEDEEFDDLGLAEQLAAGLEEEDDDEETGGQNVTADSAASLGAVLAAETPSSATQQLDTSAAETPASAADAEEEESSDEDEDDDDEDVDSPDAIDEDVLAMQHEEAQKRSEIEDLEREVQNKRQEVERTSNQLLKQRARQNLRALEDELAMKRKAFGMEVDDEE